MAKETGIADLSAPLRTLRWVPREKVKPNNYNPNKVLQANLDLLRRSILVNGWTAPIVVNSAWEIIDGFHRWMVSGQEPLLSRLHGEVPIVIVEHVDHTQDVYGTIIHNRARGVHLLEPMEKIIQALLKSGKSIEEICQELGMKKEEVYRLSGLGRDDFLRLMIKSEQYGKAYVLKQL